MPTKKPGYSLRLWIGNDDLDRLKKLSDAVELSQTEILTRIVHAGLEALTSQGNRLQLPLRFSLHNPAGESRYEPRPSAPAAFNETKKTR